MNTLKRFLRTSVTLEEEAEAAGYDCGKNGSNTTNCAFRFFGTPSLTRAWERGKARALVPRSQTSGGDRRGKESMNIHLTGALPCPFCGSSRIVKGERYFAMCVDCGATGPERNADASERKFTIDWNSRSQSPAPRSLSSSPPGTQQGE